jgi:ABC-type transport system substrate-binding protein
MLPLPMNEFAQQSLKEHCGVEVSFEVVDWNTLLGALRAAPDQPAWLGGCGEHLAGLVGPLADGALVPRPTSPAGSNAGHWRDTGFDTAFAALETERDPARVSQLLATAHARLVDDAPWLYIVHDLNPRAMSRRVRGFVSPQSWFVDLTQVDLN